MAWYKQAVQNVEYILDIIRRFMF